MGGFVRFLGFFGAGEAALCRQRLVGDAGDVEVSQRRFQVRLGRIGEIFQRGGVFLLVFDHCLDVTVRRVFFVAVCECETERDKHESDQTENERQRCFTSHASLLSFSCSCSSGQQWMVMQDGKVRVLPGFGTDGGVGFDQCLELLDGGLTVSLPGVNAGQIIARIDEVGGEFT